MTNPIYQVKWSIGAHTAFCGKICDTLWTSINYGMYTTQFFMGSPQGFNRTKISDSDIKESNKVLSKFPLNVFTHFPYVANLAGSKDNLAWNGNTKQDNKTTIMLKGLEYELSILNQLNAQKSGVVIHPGNYTERGKGLEAIGKSINKLNFPENCNTKLILENSAGQGTSLATTLTEIQTIIDNVDEDKKEHIGVCIDTCHTYAYGDYDFSKIEDIDKFFLDFDRIIGMDRFTLLHLNDSDKCMKSMVDRHACLGCGFIWKDDFESLVYLLDKCESLGIPSVLETHGIDMVVLSQL